MTRDPYRDAEPTPRERDLAVQNKALERKLIELSHENSKLRARPMPLGLVLGFSLVAYVLGAVTC